MKPLLLSAFVFTTASTTAFASAPPVETPAKYRDIIVTDAPVSSSPAIFAEPEWWKLFGDPALDDLIARALAANQDLHAAAARVEQSRALAGLARSDYWPQVAADGSVTRERTSSTTDIVMPETKITTYRAPLVLAWELDLFGRVRRLNESARADAAANAATFDALRLALTADVAASTFSLRALERELALVEQSVALRRRALDLIDARRRNGSATDLDHARAETELAVTEAEAAALKNRRAALQNALAVLVGAPAPAFEHGAAGAAPTLPLRVPEGLPATLLERRPDLAAAEHALVAASARTGVAKAAFFPSISLTGSGGYASGEVDALFRGDSRVWSIGPSIYLPIFQGGRNRANLARSRAAYDEAIARYRQSVLIAFREVQDALTATRLLAEQSVAQERALIAARRATALAQTRYDAGYVSYLEVIDAQRTSLATERASAQLEAQRLNASVALIKALGGGWGEPAASGSLALR